LLFFFSRRAENHLPTAFLVIHAWYGIGLS
jgi:hypothetical protein